MAEAGEEWKTHACLPSLVVCTPSGLAKNKKHKKNTNQKKKRKETSGLFGMMGLGCGALFFAIPFSEIKSGLGEREKCVEPFQYKLIVAHK